MNPTESNPEQSQSPESAETSATKIQGPKKAPIKPSTIVILGIAAAILGFGIVPRLRNSERVRDVAVANSNAAAVVRVVKLGQAKGTLGLTLPGNIQAIEQATINAHTSGYLVKRYVDLGDHVVQGQVLAVIESPELDQQVNVADSEILKSQANVGQAVSDRARATASVSGSKADESRYRAALGKANADHEHSKAKLVEAQSSVKLATLRENVARQKLQSARADLKKADANRTICKKTLDRWIELEKGRAVSGQDVDEKQAAYDTSVAAYEAAQAAVSGAEAELQAAQEAVSTQKAEEMAARADVDASRQNIGAASAALNSAKSLTQSANAAEAAANSRVAAAKATVSSDTANAQRVRALKSYEKLVAPFSGVITARNVDVGDFVAGSSSSASAAEQSNAVPRSGLFGLARTELLRIQVNVPEDQAARMKNGDAAEVLVQEFPDQVFPGKIKHLSGALDATSRTLLAEIEITNDRNQLKPGMYTEVRFTGASGPSLVRIPSDTLIFDKEGTRVAVVTPESTIHFLKVTVGRDLGDEVEIRSGITGKESLIADPDPALKEGDKVKVVEDAK